MKKVTECLDYQLVKKDSRTEDGSYWPHYININIIKLKINNE